MGATKEYETKFINKSLISIKVVTFFIVSGLTALHVLHSTKPLLLGLNFSEYRTITIIAPFVSILGPLIAGPLADNLAAKNPAAFEARRPLVSFGCDSEGAVIFQERCSDEATCRHWKGVAGYVKLSNCSYACQNHTDFEDLYNYWVKGSPAPTTEYSSESGGDYDYGSDGPTDTTASFRRRRAEIAATAASTEDNREQISSEILTQKNKRDVLNKVYVEPPHLCMKSKNSDGEEFIEKCHVYTDDTPSITVSTVLRAATNVENDTHSAEWCNYPLDGFKCAVPEMQARYMKSIKNEECKPMVICQVIDPYDSAGSVLENSQCIKTVGDLDTTLNGYFTIRAIGDIFPLAALTLLNTAIVVAVRETSEGRGEVCRQYIWGAIGYVILFSPLDVLYFSDNVETQQTAALIALILVIVCFLLAAIVLLISPGMPISPPEWWWHTKTGMLFIQ
uniref:Major facilitator superfamily associated domain-containing protein n=1 Tax=Megaselia scalaris TaxID=36166 RepID=T1GD57_MEGSC